MARRKLLKIISKIKADPLKYHRTLKFPEGFYWGSATSAHQVEGNNKNSDWWLWEKRSKIRFDSGCACDHYHLFKQDIELIKELGQNSHRLSIEWSRIEPEPGKWDKKAIAHYREVIATLNKKHIKPFITLHHFTNPLWFAKFGGWTNSRSIFYFNRYARYVIQELGDLVDYWLTINEPLVYVTQSFLVGNWPPEQKSYYQTYKVYLHLARAHCRTYKSIHEIYKRKNWHVPKVGFANNAVSVYSYKSHTFYSWLFIRVSDWLWNHSFYTFTGRTHDFIGINYYFHYRLKNLHFKTLRFFVEARNEHREMSQIGWEVYPQGIFDVLINFRHYRLPVFITENGVATTDEKKRTRYLLAYLKEVYHAIQAGVKVKGYFYWSLMDNFEWEKGFAPRFGLIGINYKNFKRTVRPAAKIYSAIAKTNSISQRLLNIIGH